MKHILILTSRQKVPILTYKTEEKVKIGEIVLIPFRNQSIMGIVWDISLENEKNNFNVKPIKYKFDLPALSRNFIKFITSFSRYYMIDLASCCKMVLPVVLSDSDKDKKIKKPLENNEIITNYQLPKLNDHQQKAYKEISLSDKVSLLEGVTGSGKTEVYFHLIEDNLKKGKQVLLMVPEIGLTSQLVERFFKTFGFRPAIWHSAISISKKRTIYKSIACGSQRVTIGTRSSLFLPYKDLGLIIIDEEHDNAYKQEENILYNARDAAILRASLECIKVVLVSATPSLETYQNAKTGKYQHSILTARFGKAKMPVVKIVDMKKENKNRWISKPLEESMKKGLEQGLQSLLFLNRRGYAPLMLCRTCGFRFACSSCSSWLVFHKKTNSLVCHHCGFEKPKPPVCPECSNENIISCGPGVERIAEEASILFPLAKIHLFTKEEASTKEDIELIISEMEQSKIDIIIGTQIVTKGYHFPKVSTVGIIDADLGVANIDLKANERCFQVLQQVSGRAGREEFEGSAYIQTYFPNNKVFEILSQNLVHEFYENELENREKNFLPPFSRIIAVIVTGNEEFQTLNFAKSFKNRAPMSSRVRILGPAPATMSKLKGNYRFRILLIADKAFNLQLYANEWLKNIRNVKESIRIEVDPYSFY